MEATFIEITDDDGGQQLIIAAATARRRWRHGRSKMPKQKSGGQGQLSPVDDHAQQGQESETTAGSSLLPDSANKMKYIACVDGNIKLVAGTAEKIAHEITEASKEISRAISDAVAIIILGIVSLFGYFGAFAVCYCLEYTMKSAGCLELLVILLAGIGPGMLLCYQVTKRRNS